MGAILSFGCEFCLVLYEGLNSIDLTALNFEFDPSIFEIKIKLNLLNST